MKEGALIEHRVRLGGIPMRWLSQIVEWRPNERFADLQLRGPYRYWHHLHEFRDAPGGTQMLDVVDYELPLGVLGSLAHAVAARYILERIFDFRHQAAAAAFGAR